MSVGERVGRDGVAVCEVTDDPSVEVRDTIFERRQVWVDERLVNVLGRGVAKEEEGAVW